MKPIKIKFLNENAIMPTYGSNEAAGADLYACISESITIQPGESAWISTGVAMELPVGYVGLVFARSSMGVKRGLAPANKVGVIDSDYRGEIRVVLYNHSKEPQTVQPNERVAQIAVMPVITPGFELANELNNTQRAGGGFGSTGK